MSYKVDVQMRRPRPEIARGAEFAPLDRGIVNGLKLYLRVEGLTDE